MLETDRGKFAELMFGTAAIYDTKMKTERLEAYFSAMAKYSLSEIKAGVSKHIDDPDHGSFFPKPACIARQIKNSEVSTESKAVVAWGYIVNAISAIGSYGDLVMDDKRALSAVRQMGGWKNICMTNTCDLQWKQKEFVGIYLATDEVDTKMLNGKLSGRLENDSGESSAFFKKLNNRMNG